MKQYFMSELAEQIRGVSYKPADLHGQIDADSVTLLRANNIDDGKINFDDIVFVDKSRVSKSQYLQKGDILICASSGSKNLVGKAAQVDFDGEYTFGAFCKVVRPTKIIPDYLGAYFQSNRYRRLISDLAQGANINNIKNDHIDSLIVNCPLQEEQNEVVFTIRKLIKVISCRKQQLAELDTLIKARFVEMFGNPETNEKKWVMNTFKDICTVRQGLQIPISKRLSIYEDDCYEYITVAYLNGSKEKEYIKSPKESVKCSKNDILMTRTGNTGLVITNVSGVFHNNFFLIDFDKNRYNRLFLYFYLNLDYIQKDIRKRAGTSTIPDLNHGEFYKVIVYEPPIELQNQFANFVAQVDKSKVAVQKSLDEAQLLFDSLMQEYFG